MNRISAVMEKITLIFATLLAAALFTTASAQHTVGLLGGAGYATARLYPKQEMKPIIGGTNFGLSWRYYSLPRFVGAVGLDLELMQRGFSYGYDYTSTMDDNGIEERHYKFYTRTMNTIMLPIVWQPHVYAANNRLRIFIEAAFVLSFNVSSDYSYQDDRYPAGKYEWKVPRDNRFGYGLLGGVGFAVLINQLEIGFKARYNFGYSDILKNRNKYYSNSTDLVNGEIGPNPFYYTPLRSPVDNLTFSITLGWRFNKRGFDEWYVERPNRAQRLDSFNFSQATNGSGAAEGQGAAVGSTPGGRPGGAATTGTRPGGAPTTGTRPGGAAGGKTTGGNSALRR